MKRYTLREARGRREWTQVDLAERSGVDQAHISRLERDVTTNPGIDTVSRLERALGLPAGSLKFGSTTAVA